MKFSTPRKHRYSHGDLYLGRSEKGRSDIGVNLERGALSFANSRAGKGVTEIIPNLLRWPHNALVIDPKGEAAEATAEHREAMGQAVHVLDPFGSANVPDRLRSRLNILDTIRTGTNREFTDLAAIADGLVMRYSPESGFFDNGGMDIIKGAIVDVLTNPENEKRSLPEVRNQLRNHFDDLLDRMGTNDAYGGVAKTAWGRIERSGDGPSGSFISTADDNTSWLDDPAMIDVLSDSDFALADLKTKPMTIYLVLDADLLDLHGRFLRLFVRCALNAMSQKVNGNLKGRKCLFILDEFNALGFINEIAKAAGLLPGMGVHLWPFLQDIGQLQDTYGEKKAETFLAGSDAVSFYGVTDPHTLDYVSRMIGAQRKGKKTPFGDALPDKEKEINTPLMSPQEIKTHIHKPQGSVVARRKITFTADNATLSLVPMPFFKDDLKPLKLDVPPRNGHATGTTERDETVEELASRLKRETEKIQAETEAKIAAEHAKIEKRFRHDRLQRMRNGQRHASIWERIKLEAQVLWDRL